MEDQDAGSDRWTQRLLNFGMHCKFSLPAGSLTGDGQTICTRVSNLATVASADVLPKRNYSILKENVASEQGYE